MLSAWRSKSPIVRRSRVCLPLRSVSHRCSLFFFSSRRRHTRFDCDWSSDVCSSDLTSAFLTVAQVRGKKAGAVLAVSDECLHGKFGFRDPAFLEAEQKTIEVARQALDRKSVV